MMSKERWWNTSEGLCQRYPHLREADIWPQFAAHYDKEDCREHRLKMWDLTNPPSAYDPSPSVLRSFADAVLGKNDIIAAMPCILDDGTIGDGQSVAEFRQDAAERLANAVLSFLDDKNRMKALAAEVTKEPKRKGRKTAVAQAIRAFLFFLSRTGARLPTKKELDIEANRMRKATKRILKPTKPCRYGDLIPFEGASWRAFATSQKQTKLLLVCPSQWEERLWGKSDFANSVLTPAGFTGLPEGKVGD